ncbi:MAG: HD domain-containing protein [Firmicutes bacterium]|nr:HD domain-containing protein [Bacillota bacterium]
MNIEIGQTYEFFGKVDQINTSTYDSFACNVTSADNENVIVRIKEGEDISLNKIYFFKTEAVLFKEKIHLMANDFTIIGEMDLSDDVKEKLMRAFYHYAPINLSVIRKRIEDKLSFISNPILKAITEKIYLDHADDFYLYPAATKFHHAYISGLAYHTYSMLELADGFIKVYPFLNQDLIYSGIILHDVCKIKEFDSYEGSEYTIQGRLIGHITLGANLIAITAKELGYENDEETMLLQHIIISHHYYGNFGSPKKPNIAEALIIHFIDNIDSKVCVLGEELDLVKQGDLTASIGVLERERYYKHKLSQE